MQKYKEINGNDYVKNSRTTINETMQSIQSMNSGTAFPTNNLFEGMKCYRTDLKKTYTLTDVENNTWVEDAHATLSDEATHAASATKLDTARSLNLGGAVTADAATFDGTANATINVKTLDATKLKGTASVSTTGNAATATKVVTTAADGASANIAEARMASNDLARIRVSGTTNAGELALETADDGSEPIVARQYTGVYTTPVRTANILDESGNTSFPGTVVAPKFTGALNGNAATATKLSAARKINITGNATGSAAFDGSTDIIISTTVNESKHAVNADTATHANDVTDAVIRYGVSGTDEKFTAAASGVIGLLKTQTGSNDLTSMNKLRSYIGSVNDGTDWYDVLSIRHRNGASDGQNFGLLMYSCLTNTDSIKYKKQPNGNGWTEERTLLDSSNYNNYVPTKTGAGASGTWPISITGNAATATKATSATTAAACSGNSATATKLQTPRTISLSGNASGSANFDGSGNVSINTTVSQASVADVVHKAIQPRGVYGDKKYIFYGTLTIPQNGDFFKLEVLGGYGHNSDIGQSREGTLYFRTGNNAPAHYAAYSEYHRNGAEGLKFFIVKDSGTKYRIYSNLTSFTGTMQVIPYIGQNSSFDLALITVSALPNDAVEVEQQQLIYASTVNNYAPTKTGGGASGTWGINISGNAASATTATKANTASSVAWSGVTGKPGTYPPSAHNHDSAYPSVTGTRASGTWGISISGNAASATNADKLDGYHASDIINKISAANTGGIVAASLTENGYAKFANGLILQWGSHTGGGSWYHHTFPIAFSTVFDVIDGYSSTSTGQFYGYSKNITNTGFDMRIDSSETGRYIAIGI